MAIEDQSFLDRSAGINMYHKSAVNAARDAWWYGLNREDHASSVLDRYFSQNKPRRLLRLLARHHVGLEDPSSIFDESFIENAFVKMALGCMASFVRKYGARLGGAGGKNHVVIHEGMLPSFARSLHIPIDENDMPSVGIGVSYKPGLHEPLIDHWFVAIPDLSQASLDKVNRLRAIQLAHFVAYPKLYNPGKQPQLGCIYPKSASVKGIKMLDMIVNFSMQDIRDRIAGYLDGTIPLPKGRGEVQQGVASNPEPADGGNGEPEVVGPADSDALLDSFRPLWNEGARLDKRTNRRR